MKGFGVVVWVRVWKWRDQLREGEVNKLQIDVEIGFDNYVCYFKMCV
jgi:flavin-binding protein dodecin